LRLGAEKLLVTALDPIVDPFRELDGEHGVDDIDQPLLADLVDFTAVRDVIEDWREIQAKGCDVLQGEILIRRYRYVFDFGALDICIEQR